MKGLKFWIANLPANGPTDCGFPATMLVMPDDQDRKLFLCLPVRRHYRKAEVRGVASISGDYRGFIRWPMKRMTPVLVSRIRKMNG